MQNTTLLAVLVVSLLTTSLPVPTWADESVDLLATEGFRLNNHWQLKDGILSSSKTPGGILWSKDEYEDFQISLDYKTSEKCNSGLFFRSDPRNPVQGGFEIQIASDGLYAGKHVVGSLYDAKAPSKAAGKPDGQWNTMTLTCQGPNITVVLNSEQVLQANIDDWTTPHKNPDGSKNKFKTALKDLPRTGHLGLQYHGKPIWFRNIKVSPLQNTVGLRPAPAGDASAPTAEAELPRPFGNKFRNLDSLAVGEWWTRGKDQPRNPKAPPPMDVPRDQVVAFALYTHDQSVLKLTAQLYPLKPHETRDVRLELKKNGEWVEVAKERVVYPGWSAHFRMENWDASVSVPYRVRHGEQAMFEGLIRRDPKDKDVIVVGNLSCNSSSTPGPRTEIVENLKAQDPDLLFFAGDQSYRHHEATVGWIEFGLQFRDVIRDRPTITIPDDHDVGHGNLWGENGRQSTLPGHADGGYRYPPAFVNMVQRQQTWHLPDPVDPEPVERGINVYFTNLRLGGIDFAILEDRKFKTGPAGKIPQMGPRPDHINDPSYDPKSIDLPGLELLGPRQEAFLRTWGEDWTGTEMKAVLSQTAFCGAVHLHGNPNNRLLADLDCNGWPQTPRNRALELIRRARAVHLCGDQHLGVVLKHGIDEYGDGPYAFTSPAIVNTIYGRWWHPRDEKPGSNPVLGSPLPWTGDFLDGLGNRISMMAYANPTNKADERQRGDGYGIARFNRRDRTVTFEAWPRFASVADGDKAQFPGWPLTVSVNDNDGRQVTGYLPELVFGDTERPVVQVIDEKTEDVLYTLRAPASRFQPGVYSEGPFTVKCGWDRPEQVVLKTVKAGDKDVVGQHAVSLEAKRSSGTPTNILLIMSDDLKASALPAYGNTVCKTPNLDRLAAAGMVFDRAYCQGLACAPSRPSMMRSIYPESRVTALTMGEHLQKHGLHTARVGKIFHMGVPDAPKNGTSGLDVPACWTEYHNTKSEETFTPGLYRLMNRGIATREMEGRQGAGTRERPWAAVESDQEDGSDQADHMVATKAIELLRQRKAAGKPFFLGVGFFRPHYPMVAPKKFFDMYPLAAMEIPPLVPGDLDDIPRAGRASMGDGLNDSAEGRRRMWQAYYASVTFMDEQVGRVIDELDRLGLRESTAIVFTTDHGYHLGEHGFWQKANLHEEVVRVPFMVSAPGRKPGRTSSLVELVDFYPTCTDLLGLPTPKGLQGKSLAPILHNPDATVRETALSINIRQPGGAIRSATWHYIHYGGAGEELYDMVKDPHQYTNVVNDPAYAEILKEARAKYQQRIADAQIKKRNPAGHQQRKRKAGRSRDRNKTYE